MFIGIKNCLRIYDLLVEILPKEEAVEWIETHVYRGEAVFAEREKEVVGVAFFWQISDPYDLNGGTTFPGEIPFGKYLHFPMIYIQPEFRGYAFKAEFPSVFLELLTKAMERCPGVERLVTFKNKHMRLLNLIMETDHGREGSRETEHIIES